MKQMGTGLSFVFDMCNVCITTPAESNIQQRLQKRNTGVRLRGVHEAGTVYQEEEEGTVTQLSTDGAVVSAGGGAPPPPPPFDFKMQW
jgi:predicted aldo/keto reductase-like oxidoreductase